MSGATEWDDALIAHGIKEGVKEVPDEDELWDQQQEQHEIDVMNNAYSELQGKSLDQLKELEDEIPDNDMDALRKKRLQELKRQAQRNKFGRLFKISEPEWKSEVTECEKDVFVVVFMYAPGKEECTLVERICSQLAQKFKDVKFVQIEGRLAVRNWPDQNCPSLLVYLGGDIKLQLIGLESMGGIRATPEGLEWALSRINAVKTDLHEDPTIAQQRTKFNRLDDARRAYLDEGDDWLGD